MFQGQVPDTLLLIVTSNKQRTPNLIDFRYISYVKVPSNATIHDMLTEVIHSFSVSI